MRYSEAPRLVPDASGGANYFAAAFLEAEDKRALIARLDAYLAER